MRQARVSQGAGRGGEHADDARDNQSVSVITPSRRESLRRLAWRLDTPAGLVAMFAVAFLLRLADRAAPGLLRRPAAVPAVGGAPRRRRHAPLLRAGPVRRLSAGLPLRPLADGKISATPGYLLLKLPAILADLGARLDRRNVRRADSRPRRCASGGRSARWSSPRRALQPGRHRAQRGLGPGGRRCRPCSCSWSLLLLFTGRAVAAARDRRLPPVRGRVRDEAADRASSCR